MACKKFSFLFLVCMLFWIDSVPAFALNQLFPLPPYVQEGDNFVLETFVTSTITKEAKDFLRNQFGSSRAFITSEAVGGTILITFYDVPTGVGIDYIDGDVNGNGGIIHFDKTSDSLLGVTFQYDVSTKKFTFHSFVDTRKDVIFFDYILSQTVFTTIGMPLPALNYDYNLTGSHAPLIIRDDGGLEDEPDKDGLLDFIIGIFVPDSDYFKDWFNEILDAINQKAGGLGDLFTHVKNSLAELKTSDNYDYSLKLTLPNNHFYSGFKGFSVDFLVSAQPYFKFLKPLFNGVLIIFTAIICYRKLTALFQE